MTLGEEVLRALAPFRTDLLTQRHLILRLVEAVALQVLAHRHPVLRIHLLTVLSLLHAVFAHLLTILSLRAIYPHLLTILRLSAIHLLAITCLLDTIRAELLTILSLRAVRPHFIARRDTLLRMRLPHLLSCSDARLRTSGPLLAHLCTLGVLRSLHGEALCMLLSRHRHALLALLKAGRRLTLLTGARKTAAAMAAATAAAVDGNLMASASAASVTVIAMRPCDCRGCDRQRGNACGEEHPGHDNVSFRTVKTARSRHRSNA
jgi:hypothetical protein